MLLNRNGFALLMGATRALDKFLQPTTVPIQQLDLDSLMSLATLRPSPDSMWLRIFQMAVIGAHPPPMTSANEKTTATTAATTLQACKRSTMSRGTVSSSWRDLKWEKPDALSSSLNSSCRISFDHAGGRTRPWIDHKHTKGCLAHALSISVSVSISRERQRQIVMWVVPTAEIPSDKDKLKPHTDHGPQSKALQSRFEMSQPHKIRSIRASKHESRYTNVSVLQLLLTKRRL
jgi:hypothetical protein